MHLVYLSAYPFSPEWKIFRTDFHWRISTNLPRLKALPIPLTGLFSKRYLKDDFEKELARSSRSESPFCVALLDIDHFTAVNDNYGHLTGDDVLREAADFLRNSLRLSDRIYHFGGGAFLFLLPDTIEEEAVVLGQRIREKFEAYRFQSIPKPLTMSIGITRSHPDSSFDLLIKKSEAHLNSAKEKGRNNVVCDSCPTES